MDEWEEAAMDDSTTNKSRLNPKALKYGLWLAIIGTVLNILGNLVASWIQQGLLGNVFAPVTIFFIVSLSILGIIITYRMKQRRPAIRNIWEAATIFGVFGLISGWILAGAFPIRTNQSPFTNPEFMRPAELLRLYNDLGTRPLIIDVRDSEDYAKEHIANAVSIPYFPVMTDHDPSKFSLPKDKLIVLYCDCKEEFLSVRVAQLMHYEYDFQPEYLRVLNDGLAGWKDVGGPTGSLSSPSPTSVP